MKFPLWIPKGNKGIVQWISGHREQCVVLRDVIRNPRQGCVCFKNGDWEMFKGAFWNIYCGTRLTFSANLNHMLFVLGLCYIRKLDIELPGSDDPGCHIERLLFSTKKAYMSETNVLLIPADVLCQQHTYGSVFKPFDWSTSLDKLY
jgi:hypothetical protein